MPRAGGDDSAITGSARDVSFNPCPRAGGDTRVAQTHAGNHQVSIHAPARGATFHGRLVGRGAAGFNPRPRAGGDRLKSWGGSAQPDVSIHAPARGATTLRGSRKIVITRFNPRPRAGGDPPTRLP